MGGCAACGGGNCSLVRLLLTRALFVSLGCTHSSKFYLTLLFCFTSSPSHSFSQAMLFLEEMCDAGMPPDPETANHLVLQVRYHMIIVVVDLFKTLDSGVWGLGSGGVGRH